jgi:hypothetical protein
MKKITLQGFHLTPRDRDALTPPAGEAEPTYERTVDYDPVLADHCGTGKGERLFPASAMSSPRRRSGVRVV